MYSILHAGILLHIPTGRLSSTWTVNEISQSHLLLIQYIFFLLLTSTGKKKKLWIFYFSTALIFNLSPTVPTLQHTWDKQYRSIRFWSGKFYHLRRGPELLGAGLMFEGIVGMLNSRGWAQKARILIFLQFHSSVIQSNFTQTQGFSPYFEK